eukprot:CAMPEP_0171971478 /NCGR_PEP_ID=MMETSP0993-20121228/217997_1 /TAXON_ID=483369 /ORGANISM="non described non described, Strain CCMP2098" /LENGTH=157 /DNA_ID=CAMNT_0012621819 /DNA_START=43 /DNA_END=512 /DNA_ORIENTATION=+
MSGAKATFPQKLFAILNTESSEVLSWDHGGKAFRIHDQDTFCVDILPRYFRHSKFSSFQRQLNLYGFQKVHIGPLAGAYYHEEFAKGDVAAVHRIKRAVRSADEDGGGDNDDDADDGNRGGVPSSKPAPDLGAATGAPPWNLGGLYDSSSGAASASG